MSDLHPHVSYVRDKIARLDGLESVGVGKDGGINVIIAGGINRRLREDILDIGRRAMVPVRVQYRMADGNVIGEDVSDYYKPIHIPGFAGDTSEAPPEEVAAEPKGALKLKRIRSKSRGRPVVGWKMGEKEIRRGTKVKFKAPASLQWTLGRTLNVKPGATAVISDLASRRPLLYMTLGGYESVELPVHMLGHVFDVDKAMKEAEGEKALGYLTPELARLINVVGFGNQDDIDYVQKKKKKDKNSPVYREVSLYGGGGYSPDADSSDSPETNESDDEEMEDMLVRPGDEDEDPSEYQRALILGKK